MAIKSYEKDGKTLYKVYVNVRSKQDRKIRVQKTLTELSSLSLARREENRLYLEAGQKIRELEGKCEDWESVIHKWAIDARSGILGNYTETTILSHMSTLKHWTRSWYRVVASEIGKAEGRALIKRMTKEGKSVGRIKGVKHTVNVVYNYGIEEGLIKGVKNSPVHGIKLHQKSERVPDILTLDEIKKLLRFAKEMKHPWYPVWSMALLTGMRNGELYALEWEDVDLENDNIRVSKSFAKRENKIKCTKAGYWRNVPISPQLKELLIELKVHKDSGNVLPRFGDWRRGDQSRILKTFLFSVGLPKVKFHALRACFATQLLAKGTPPAIVMKICGWRDLKTMEFYVRVAGVDEKGATDCLEILPSEGECVGNVVRLFT
jgi:integrase